MLSSPARRGSRRPHVPRAPGRSAFTVAELMVVVLIIGMAAYVVSISVDAILPGERLNSSVRSLGGTLQGTRSDAISRNIELWVEYDLEEERYRIVTPFRAGGGSLVVTEEDDDQRVKLPWELLEKGIEISSVVIAGVGYTDGQVFVRFDPLGMASDHSIILTQPAFENFYTVEVLALTGLIRFHDGVFIREAPQDSDFNG
jgi:Tfp pilus assembly protein FimT